MCAEQHRSIGEHVGHVNAMLSLHMHTIGDLCACCLSVAGQAWLGLAFVVHPAHSLSPVVLVLQLYRAYAASTVVCPPLVFARPYYESINPTDPIDRAQSVQFSVSHESKVSEWRHARVLVKLLVDAFVIWIQEQT